MASEKERVDAYLDILSRMEPDLAPVDEPVSMASIAVSLKRGADALESIAKSLEPLQAFGPLIMAFKPLLTDEDVLEQAALEITAEVAKMRAKKGRR